MHVYLCYYYITCGEENSEHTIRCNNARNSSWRYSGQWRGKCFHMTEIFSASLSICEGNPLMTGALTKGQWRGALIFSLVCALANVWVNNRDAGDLRRHRSHYYVTVMVRAATCPVAHINVHLSISVQKTRKIAKSVVMGLCCSIWR